MVRASIDDFSGKDLTAPTSIRVKRILSGLVNFYLYEREQAADFFYPAQEEDVELEMEYSKLLEEEGAIEEEIKFLELVALSQFLPYRPSIVVESFVLICCTARQDGTSGESSQGREWNQGESENERCSQAEESCRE